MKNPILLWVSQNFPLVRSNYTLGQPKFSLSIAIAGLVDYDPCGTKELIEGVIKLIMLFKILDSLHVEYPHHNKDSVVVGYYQL